MTEFNREIDDNELDLYPKRDLVIVKGKNAIVWDDRGREYIDCVAGHGVVNVGHCNARVVKAIQNQAEKLISCTGIFDNDSKSKLLKMLVDISPASLNKAFLCNSGTESIEAAIKFARYSTRKTEFICAMRGFHGRTLGSLSATYNPKYRNDFEPLVPGFKFVPFNNFDKIESVVSKNTAGIILEIIQGEGGINLGNHEYFTQIRRMCDEKEILLIIDEVQTGFGRTGKMFACDHFGLQPDILCLAKAIAGGMPMGAVLCSNKITASKGKHGSTFGGNPLACEAALAAITFILDSNLADQSLEKGDYICSRLKEFNLQVIREIRHKGLMIGIELKVKVKPFITRLMKKGILVLPAGATVIRLLPPLTISYEELDKVINELYEVLRPV